MQTQEHRYICNRQGRQRWGPGVLCDNISLSPLFFSPSFLPLLFSDRASAAQAGLRLAIQPKLASTPESFFLYHPNTGMTQTSCHKRPSFSSIKCKVSRWQQQKRELGESGVPSGRWRSHSVLIRGLWLWIYKERSLRCVISHQLHLVVLSQ